MSWRLIIIPLLLVSLVFACTGYRTQTRGIYHRVKSGETLWSIAKAYDIKVQELAEVNNITDPKVIGADSILFVPDADQVIDDIMSSVRETESSVKPAQKEKISALKSAKEEPQLDKSPFKNEGLSPRNVPKGKGEALPKKELRSTTAKSKDEGPVLAARVPPEPETKQRIELKGREKTNGGEGEKIKFDKERFIWPVKGKLRSKFGIQPDGMYYNGIKITAKEGAPVFASANGTVIFSAFLKNYGETIIIKHDDNYATVYTNLSNRIVRVDDQIKKGNRIAFLGKNENKEGAHLNFEIRYKNRARNPLFFLP